MQQVVAEPADKDRCVPIGSENRGARRKDRKTVGQRVEGVEQSKDSVLAPSSESWPQFTEVNKETLVAEQRADPSLKTLQDNVKRGDS